MLFAEAEERRKGREGRPWRIATPASLLPLPPSLPTCISPNTHTSTLLTHKYTLFSLHFDLLPLYKVSQTNNLTEVTMEEHQRLEIKENEIKMKTLCGNAFRLTAVGRRAMARAVVTHICISSFPPPYFHGRRVLTAPNNTHAQPPGPKHPLKLPTAPRHSPRKPAG